MAWVRIDDNAPHHRKMLQAGPAACWLWVCGLAYCQRVRTDGFIPAEALSTLGVSSWKKPTASLLASGLWHKDEGGYRVHDYLSWNATKEERAERAQAHRERTAKWREQQRDASQGKERDESVTRHTESSVTLLPSSPLPSSPLREEKLQQPRAREGPRDFDRTHTGHLFDFCGFICLSEEKVQEFVKTLPGGLAVPQNFDAVVEWAGSVRAEWANKAKPELKWFEFWEARWRERAANSSAKTSKTKAALARFVERHSS